MSATPHAPSRAPLVPPRLPGWPEALAQHLLAARAQPFAWGLHDCCTFAAAAVQAITGWHPAPELLAHRSARQALRTLQRATGHPRGVGLLATQRLGPPLAHPLLAQRGDLALVPSAVPGWDALAVCCGDALHAPHPVQGLTRLPIDRARAAWRV